ncbi:hypothetical protein PUR59_01315 [Streptomyces sp. SP18ES09]|uniref:hypothetical protein n=1 Tax=Streptomyces sp. SP18ES09 TaxID=3002532 RepID=UPI002E79DFE8|nr:hypothetical protein [Streptomyces sp. SP18ES09]MEE1813679.1 hypothetical protein [Streptomyces sp. SP18ES09]
MTQSEPAQTRHTACLLDACARDCTTECREVINRSWTALRGAQPEPAQTRHTVDTITSDALDRLYAELEIANAKVAELNRAGDVALSAVCLMQRVEQRADQAEAALDAVRKLHKRFADDTCFADGESYPCSTIRALDAHTA